jgi:biopolymer transport protein ExbD
MTTSAHAIPNGEPNITPMIDVLLVLLIVFMVSVVQVHRTMDVQLPEPCVGTCASAVPIVLEILPGPTYRLNQREIPPSRLAAELSAAYRIRPDRTLQLAGRAGVRYDDIMKAMDIAKGAGVTVLGIVPKATTSQ